MLFSLARMQTERPSPPYWLGGRLLFEADRFLLSSGPQKVAFRAEPGLLAEVQAGDVVAIEIIGTEPEFEARSLRVLHRSSNPQTANFLPLQFVKFQQDVREHWLQLGLTEVLTPSLVVCPGLEPSLEPFATEQRWGRERVTRYLPTSPEIHLKKILAMGVDDLFEIKTCYRNGEKSGHHSAEFQMLEWYRAFGDLDLIRQDLSSLLAFLQGKGWGRANLGPIDLQTTTFSNLFEEHFQFRLTPKSGRDDLSELCRQQGLHFTSEDSFDDLFHRLWLDKIELQLPKTPLIVSGFPPSQSALAKLNDEGWAQRFEFFWQGMEIANAFFEVTDPHEQKSRWQRDAIERKRLGTSELPQDEELLGALERGIPPTGGIALGLERLFMAFTGLSSIDLVKF